MEKELGLVYRLAIDALLTAVIMGVVLSFTVVANDAINTKNRLDEASANISKYSQLYEFDDKIVNGSDVVDIILTYARIYDFVIELDGRTIEFSRNAENETNSLTGRPYGITLWSRENINRRIGTNVSSRFVSTIMLDESAVNIIGIKFKGE